MLITVFTPTYNRASLLPRLYESLKVQTCRDFEWLIVDDGSTDDTESLIQSYIKSDKISIRYYKQTNGGKHRAINRGVREARGELFFIVDSDDSLPSEAIETIANYWQQVKEDPSFGGVAGYMAHHDGELIGKGSNADVLDCNSIELRYKYHVLGDMAEVFRTTVLREIPFLEIDGERFCPEALVWNRIAQKYRVRVFHKRIYYRDYLNDGLTAKIVRIRMESPVASVTHYTELNSYDIPFKDKVKAAINYWRFRPCVPQGTPVPKLPWRWAWCRPIGWLMHLRDS